MLRELVSRSVNAEVSSHRLRKKEVYAGSLRLLCSRIRVGTLTRHGQDVTLRSVHPEASSLTWRIYGGGGPAGLGFTRLLAAYSRGCLDPFPTCLAFSQKYVSDEAKG